MYCLYSKWRNLRHTCRTFGYQIVVSLLCGSPLYAAACWIKWGMEEGEEIADTAATFISAGSGHLIKH